MDATSDAASDAASISSFPSLGGNGKSADCVCCEEGLGEMETRGGPALDVSRYSSVAVGSLVSGGNFCNAKRKATHREYCEVR
jgi:hypothetical protein